MVNSSLIIIKNYFKTICASFPFLGLFKEERSTSKSLVTTVFIAVMDKMLIFSGHGMSLLQESRPWSPQKDPTREDPQREFVCGIPRVGN